MQAATTPAQEDAGSGGGLGREKPELRVLQVFTALSVGGAETWMMALLKYFREREAELPVRLKIDICLTGGFQGTFDEEARALGARLFYLPYSRRGLSRFVPRWRRILASGRYHAIHDHQDYTSGLHFFFGLGLLPPVRIAHVHNPLSHIASYSSSPARRATIALGKYLLARLATHIVGTSRQVLSEYGLDAPAFARIARGAAHCGFDVARFEGGRAGGHLQERADVRREFGWGEGTKVILFVGRLNTAQKNPGFALEVAHECARRDPDVRLLMAGDAGEDKGKFERAIAGWGLSQKLLLLGVRHDVPRLMRGADLLLFPSLAEGLGMVAVEAQAAGLRVLASDAVPRECCVVPEAVRFCPLAAGADPWADEVGRLLRMERLEAHACSLAVRASNFSIENSTAKLLRLYRGER